MLFCQPMHPQSVVYLRKANTASCFWRFTSLLLLGLAFPSTVGMLFRVFMYLMITSLLVDFVALAISGLSAVIHKALQGCRAKAFHKTRRCCGADEREAAAAPELIGGEEDLAKLYARCEAKRRRHACWAERASRCGGPEPKGQPEPPPCTPEARPKPTAPPKPTVEIWASADAYTVQVDVPGIPDGALAVTAQPGFKRGGVAPSLTIEGSAGPATDASNHDLRDDKYDNGRRRTAVRLPHDADVAAATAHHALGQLTLTVPRASTSTRIPIAASPHAAHGLAGAPPRPR